MEKQVIDLESGEVIVREFTAEELEIHKQQLAEFEAAEAKKAELEAARQEILARLGLTDSEVKLLLAQ